MSRTSLFIGLVITVGAAGAVALWMRPSPEPDVPPAPKTEPANVSPTRAEPLRPVARLDDPTKLPVPDVPRKFVRTSTPARAVKPEPVVPAGTPEPMIGLELAEVSASELADMKVPEGVTGVVVRDVDPASPAAHAMLRPGDVIARAQRDKITSIDALKTSIGTRDYTMLTVYRDGYPFQVLLFKPSKLR
ncbi:PDZ domain-containing protein [Myxococcota bacterium]|nr:PDZ domain-containing protein [Myxococcota bacterium]